MVTSRYRMGLMLIAGILCGGLVACASLPEISRTAVVYDISIDEALSQENIVVKQGDEVRFVNLRKLDIQIDIPNIKSYELACQRGFENAFGSIRESVTLKANETAAVCFKNPGVVRFIVRKETAQAGGKRLLEGSIAVE